MKLDYSDVELEERVWNRITGIAQVTPTQPPKENGCSLFTMLQDSEESAGVYRYLTAHTMGLRRDRLSMLYRRESDHAAAIRGMLILNGDSFDMQNHYEPGKEGLNRILAKAYRRSCQIHKNYLRASHDSDYDCTFENLAAEETQTMQTLLQLIGE